MSQNKATVLIVDDEVDLVEVFKEEFEERGCKVFTANNGRQALEIVKREKLDIVLTDICMPEMNGMELLRAIEKQPRRPFVITMSGYSTHPEAELLKEGSAGFIPKPIHYEQIVELIENYVFLVAEANQAAA